MNTVFVQFLVLAVAINVVLSLKCFVCTNGHHSCKEPFNRTKASLDHSVYKRVDPEDVCMKHVVNFGEKHVDRKYMRKEDAIQYCKNEKRVKKSSFCGWCQSHDGCNGGMANEWNSRFLFAAVTCAIVLWWRRR